MWVSDFGSEMGVNPAVSSTLETEIPLKQLRRVNRDAK
jgi:hypothetical protein